MKVEVVKKRQPMPKKNMVYRDSCVAEINRFEAVRALMSIEIGQHVRFSGIERSRIYNYLRSQDLKDKQFSIALLDTVDASVFGVWRVR